MKVVFVFKKADFSVSDWTGDPQFEGRSFQGKFGIEGTVHCESRDFPSPSREAVNGCVLFVHASDTDRWSNDRLHVSEIEAHFGGGELQLICTLPFTTTWNDWRAPEIAGGKAVSGAQDRIFGRASVTALLRRLEDGLQFRTPAEVLAGLTEEGQPSQEYAQALVILCQGYLAAHADDCGDGAVLSEADTPDDERLVKRALNEMGWIDVVRARPDSLDLTALSTKRTEVRVAAWWRLAFPGALVKGELGALGEREHVRVLLRDIERDAELRPGVVARAFLELTGKT